MDNSFGIIEDKIPNGLFGCTMTWILEILPYLKRNGIYPNWNIDTHCYGQIFPAILIPKQINTTTNIKISILNIKKSHEYFYKKTECQLAHDLFFEYFDISYVILDKVDAIYDLFGKKTLGIHFRGTDKHKEADYISQENVIKNIMAFLTIENDFDTIFIAADEESFISKIKQACLDKKKYNLIFTNSIRSHNKNPIHLHNTGIVLAQEAMIDSLLLSKCNYVIKTSSCLSDWVKIWNPSIEVYNLNKFRYSYFPQAIIPVKSYC